MMMASIFLGAGYVVLIKGFPTVDVLYNRLSPLTQRYLNIIGYIIGFVFLTVLLWMSADSTIEAIKTKSLTTGLTMWPQYPIYLIATIGIFLFAAQVLRGLIGLLDSSLRRK
jgi:TRAP-type C4-dicarboxylate transport system permease small subunit